MVKRDSEQIVAKRVTKPSVITDAVVSNLCMRLAKGHSVEIACAMEGISRTAFYEYAKKNPVRKELFDLVRSLPADQALTNIIKAINDGDLRTSMWYLEKVCPETYNPRYKIEMECQKVTTFRLKSSI